MLSKVKTWWRFQRALRQHTKLPFYTDPGELDMVVVPCWQRPEFLWHCLDNLAKAEGIDELRIIVRPDTGYSAENLRVVQDFTERLPGIEIQYPPAAPYRRTKQSANILLGYLQAAARARRFVFLVEEDIMVARDFFRWHRAVHQARTTPLFCSIAVANPNRKVAVSDDVDGFYLSRGDYCSTGVCFDRAVIRSLLAPHVRRPYLARPKAYIRRHFPDSELSLGFVEQDGLIRRLQERCAWPIAWPCVPRAFHAGYYGYHRSGGAQGDLNTRIETLTHTIFDDARLHDAAASSDFPDDCIPCQLELPRWTTLREIAVPQ